MSTQPQPPIKGLPDGVVLVRIGVATDDDYEITNHVDPVSREATAIIYKGPRAGAASGVIVAPAEGYVFRPNIKTMGYDPVKVFPAKTIKATVEFSVSNSYDEQTVVLALEKLKQVPGFIETPPAG